MIPAVEVVPESEAVEAAVHFVDLCGEPAPDVLWEEADSSIHQTDKPGCSITLKS